MGQLAAMTSGVEDWPRTDLPALAELLQVLYHAELSEEVLAEVLPPLDHLLSQVSWSQDSDVPVQHAVATLLLLAAQQDLRSWCAVEGYDHLDRLMQVAPGTCSRQLLHTFDAIACLEGHRESRLEEWERVRAEESNQGDSARRATVTISRDRVEV